MKRKLSGKSDNPVPWIDTLRCDGCGYCVHVCPENVLRIENGAAVVADPQRCEYHGLCEMVCPVGAIQRAFEIVPPGKVDDEDASDRAYSQEWREK